MIYLLTEAQEWNIAIPGALLIIALFVYWIDKSNNNKR